MTDNQPSRQPVTSDSLGLKPGEIFWNNYRVLNVIGKGGVSTVYKAENVQSKQFVAIKLLHAHRTRDEELVRRFIREAQTTTKLDHPHAIHIWEWGIDQNERPFMIIEYLAGETLSRKIQSECPHQNLCRRKRLCQLGIAHALARPIPRVRSGGCHH